MAIDAGVNASVDLFSCYYLRGGSVCFEQIGMVKGVENVHRRVPGLVSTVPVVDVAIPIDLAQLVFFVDFVNGEEFTGESAIAPFRPDVVEM